MSAAQFTSVMTEKLLSNRRIEPTGCWVWTGPLTTHGYGATNFQRRQVKAHQAAFRIWKGEVPAGMCIDHLCRNRACFNPDHLECVTVRENTLRGVGPSAVAATVTHCPSGHEYTEPNTYVSRKGQRVCRVCRATQNREYRARAKATGQEGGSHG